MDVLIVEDDRALGHFLDKALTVEGHDVAVTADGDAALAYMASRRPEVMVLDLVLPGRDGFEVLMEMHDRFRTTSVLVLTGRSEKEDKMRCLELGADDFMLKPFSFHELQARLRALARRRRQFEDPVLRFGELEMDLTRRRVTQAGREVELTATEFSLLESLLRRRGERVCSRKELLEEVWRVPAGEHSEGPGTNIVEVYINYLRKKLGRSPGKKPGPMRAANRSVIRTVRGEGYMLQGADA